MGDRPGELSVATAWEGATATVSLEGPLDMHSAPRLEATLAEVLGRSPDAVRVDAGAIGFVDSAGLRTLLAARREAEGAGATLHVSRSAPSLDRLLTMTGCHQILTV